MSRIDITHAHSLSTDAARQAIDTLAAKLTEKYKVRSNWAGDTLSLNGSGVDGAIKLVPGAVNVVAELGFPASLMTDTVKNEIKRVLEEKLG